MHQQVQHVVVDPVAGLVERRAQLEAAEVGAAGAVVLLEDGLPEPDAAPEGFELLQSELARVVHVQQGHHGADRVLAEAVKLELCPKHGIAESRLELNGLMLKHNAVRH